MRWWRRSPGDPALLESRFGKLELRVMEALWQRDEPAAVRDLQPNFPQSAYTTLMTTLDRLYRKGVVDRVKSGRAFIYHPRFSRDALQSGLAADAVQQLLGTDPASVRPILSFFVEEVGRHDRELLDELAMLVRAKLRDRQDKP